MHVQTLFFLCEGARKPFPRRGLQSRNQDRSSRSGSPSSPKALRLSSSHLFLVSLQPPTMTSAAHPPSILTIAGSDPSGGAGIQVSLHKRLPNQTTFVELSSFSFPSKLTSVSSPGRSQNVHLAFSLRTLGHHCSYLSEHRRCEGSPYGSSRVCRSTGQLRLFASFPSISFPFFPVPRSD